MERIIVEVDNSGNAKLLSVLLKSLEFVKSIKIEKTDPTDASFEDKDWVRPGRPASDAEHETMLAEAKAEYEAGLGMTIHEAKERTLEKFKAWKKENQL